jgi:predicted DNA-binding WGR domain protein
MKHSLIYQDERTSKLWNLERSENRLTVSYGYSDSDMSSLIATFENAEQCNDTTELLIGEKLKKGYTFLQQKKIAV